MEYYFNVHTHKRESLNSKIDGILNVFPRELDDDLDNLSLSSAVHPWFIERDTLKKEYEIIKNAILTGRLVAIGECGLDKIANIDYSLQKSVFTEHLKIADQFSLPVIIHSVKSSLEVLTLIRNFKNIPNFIIHGFSGSYEEYNKFLDYGCYISFFPKALCGNGKKLNKIIKDIPLSRLFIETDDSDISIKSMYDLIATIKEIDLKLLVDELTKNRKRVFFIPITN